jgi:aminoglycoside phosphotransferase family enzyme
MTSPDISLEAKVAFLMQPGSYPARPRNVEFIETHMAWVFLTPRRAWKLKKPVRRSFLDFSTIEARRRDCEAEVRLNRRLAPDTYLETVPLTAQPDGTLALRGAGQPVDWLVKMRRLPGERMLDRMIAQSTWQLEDLDALGVLLARFYARSPAEPMTDDRYRQRLQTDIVENLRELLACHDLREQQASIRREIGRQQEFVENQWSLPGQRVAEGRIIEAHGDLRPEHVALTDPPVIIDCLEFNRSFRILDPADELAYFAIECERLGAPQVGEATLLAYSRRSGDAPPPELVAFHRSFRALLRAKIAMWHLQDVPERDRSRWIRRTQDYIALAERWS